MSRTDVITKLNEIFVDIFDDESIVLSEQTSAVDIEEWDSLEHINIISAIESDFGIKLSLQEAVTLKNIGDMIDVVLAKLQQ